MGPGREAATVRHVLLVLVLVAASFLGGAFVNGPGLRWVQTQLLGSLGLSDGGEIAAVDRTAGLRRSRTEVGPGDDSVRGGRSTGLRARRGPAGPQPDPRGRTLPAGGPGSAGAAGSGGDAGRPGLAGLVDARGSAATAAGTPRAGFLLAPRS